MRYRLTGDKNLLVDDIEQSVNQSMRQRWPHMSSEGVLTDRIGYNPRTVSYMAGALPEMSYQGFPHHAVTYTGAGRDFAAVVEAATAKELQVLYYSFADRPRRVGLRPWKLEPGARYRIAAGQETREQELAERGAPIEGDDSAAPGSGRAHRADRARARARGPRGSRVVATSR